MTNLAFGGTVLTNQAKGWQIRSKITITGASSSTGTQLYHAVIVKAVDANNSVQTSFNGSVTLSSSNTNVPFTPNSVITVQAVQGVATFPNVAFNASGSTNLTATSTGATSTTVTGMTVADVTPVTVNVSGLYSGEDYIVALIEQGGDTPISQTGDVTGVAMNAASYMVSAKRGAIGSTTVVPLTLSNVPVGITCKPYLFCLGTGTLISDSVTGSSVTVANGTTVSLNGGAGGAQATLQGGLDGPTISTSPATTVAVGNTVSTSVTGGSTGNYVRFVFSETSQTIMQAFGPSFGHLVPTSIPNGTDFACRDNNIGGANTYTVVNFTVGSATSTVPLISISKSTTLNVTP